MSGIYFGRFDNGPLNREGNTYSSCIYLIGCHGNSTSAYAFAINQYASGHLLFNRMSNNNSWELDSWKKLI